MKLFRRQLCLVLVTAALAALPAAAPAVHIVGPASETPLALSERERAWLDEHPIIRASNDPAWAPIVFDGPDGMPAGLAAELMAVIAQRLDLNIEYVPGQTWLEALEASREGEVDLLLAVTRDPTRDRHLEFTAPFMTYQSVIVVRDDTPFVPDISALLDRRFALVAGYSETARLIDKYPGLNVTEFDTVGAALQAVAVGKADATVGSIAVMHYKIRDMGLTNLKVAAPSDDEERRVHFAVRSDWPQLATILNKGLAAVSIEERQRILDRWVNVEYDRGLDPAQVARRAWQGIGAALVLAMLGWLYLRRLKREVAERKRAEARTEAAQRQLQEIADTVPASVYQLRTGEHEPFFSFMNARMRDFLSADAQRDAAPGFKSALEVIHEEDRPRLLEAVRRSAEMLLPLEIEFRVRVRGAVQWLHCGAVPRRLAGSDAMIWNGYTIDITERKRLDRELAAAKEVAENASRAKSEFLANMSHEIRTPMNAIIGLSHLTMKTDLSARQRDYLTKISGAAQSLLRIINDVLDFSKIEAGQLQLEQIRFNLQTVFDDLISIIGHRAGEKGLELRVDLAPELPAYLIGDPLRLSQVLLNLTSNAVKFTQRGHIVVRAQLLEQDGDRLRLRFSVEDTGVGLSREQAARLFKSFVQADSSTTRQYGGTGLGLSISKRLVGLMEGEIGVDSEPGQGSTFWFTVTLLRGAAPDETAAPVKTGPPLNLRGARVLLVEDNQINQQVAAELLQSAGVRVDIAGNGLEALRLVRAQSYDAILMDVQMPVMDGLQATQAIRDIETLKTLPIIAMTASVLRGDRDRCLAAGMNDYISKPVNVEQMLATLARWLPARTVEMPVAEPPAPPPRDALPDAIDGLDVAGGLKRVGGDRALYRRLLLQFREHSGNAARDLRAAHAAGDRAALKSATHTLKGVAGNLSVSEVYKAAKKLEVALRKAGASAEAEVEALAAAHERVMASLAALPPAPAAGGNGNGHGPPPDKAALRRLVRDLDERLSGSDASAVQALEAVKGALQGAYPTMVQELERLIGTYNFEQARTRLAQFAQTLDAS